MRIRPCIDIHDGRVKQIVGASLRDGGDGRRGADGASVSGPVENFISDSGAAHYARIYRERALPGGHVILLNGRGTKEWEADAEEACEALAAFPGGMQLGGGIGPDTAERFLSAGASHVIVTSYVFRDGQLDMRRLGEMKEAVRPERLVLDLSCRRTPDGAYRIVTDRWQRLTMLDVTEETLDALSAHCAEFLIHAADAEGRRQGIEQPLVEVLGRFAGATGFPLTYAGGVHALDDLDRIAAASRGRIDVTVGSALDLFGGSLTLDSLCGRCRDLSGG